MSATDATQSISPPPEGTEARNAYEAFREAEEGDMVLYGGRKEPLRVRGSTEENGRYKLMLDGPRGGKVVILEEYIPGTDQPAYRSDRGEEALDLRIVERAEAGSDGSNPTSSDSKTTPQDDPNGTSSRQAKMAAGAIDDDDIVVGEDVGQPWPTVDEDEAEVDDLDDEVYDMTGDPMLDADDLFSGTIEGGPIRNTSKNPIDEFGTYTFVDELLQFGQDVPKTVNNWHLFEYGVVEDAHSRRAGWVNFDTEEILVLAAIRQPGEEQPEWYVWHVRDVPDAGTPDPDFEGRDPYEALDVVSDVLYADADGIDISIQEGPNGSVKVVDAMEGGQIGDRIFSDIGLDNLPSYAMSLPGVGVPFRAGQQAGEALNDATDGGGGYVDYPGGAAAWARDTSDNILDYYSENKQDFAKLVKFALVYSAISASKKVAGIGVGPIIEQDKLGVYVDERYTANDIDDIPLPVPFADQILGAIQNDGRGEAASFSLDSEFYVNPERFDFGNGPVTEAGLNYDNLVNIAELLNFDQLELNIPGSGAIRELRVAEDEEGNVKVVREEGSTRSRSSSGRNRRSRSSGSSGTTSLASAGAVSRNDVETLTHRKNGGPTDAHLEALANLLNAADSETNAVAAANKMAALYLIDALNDEGYDDWNNVGSGDIGQTFGEEWRPGTKDILSDHFRNARAATNGSTIADIIERYEGDGMNLDPAVQRVFDTNPVTGAKLREQRSESTVETDEDGGGDDDDGGGENDDVDDATSDIADSGSDQIDSTLNDIAQDAQLSERLQEAAKTGETSEGLEARQQVDAIDMILQGSPDSWGDEEWELLAAWSGESKKADIRNYIARNWDTEAAAVKMSDDYTDEEKRDGDMTKDMFEG